MAAARITGITGSVTYASGYVTSAWQWAIRPSAEILETTTFTPTGTYRMTEGGLLDWTGDYKCRQNAKATTAISGPTYLSFPFEWDIDLSCAPLEATVLAATYRSRDAGLLSARGSYSLYVEDTAALPVAGTTASGVFTVDTGKTYTVPLIVRDIDISVAGDGTGRIARVSWENTGAVTTAGGIPVPGTTGAATFVAGGVTRQYSGSILVTSVRWRGNVAARQADFEIAFEGVGALTAA